MPHWSQPQATVLAHWSLGLVLARSCTLTAVAVFLAGWLQRQEQARPARLREFCDEAPAKQGTQRQALHVETWFVPRLRSVLSRCQGRRLA